ncbi:hypothetical protein KP509_34G056000 [Ceratopteris richardii]|uniref:Uncharacterized protein n=1 Tax=Ceratopteris richardii TaxID=49495 RepID=A0A8T2QKN3_CERRI|nr:hypothetical protein KP509_34G056000 [Ceratopteris richardii]
MKDSFERAILIAMAVLIGIFMLICCAYMCWWCTDFWKDPISFYRRSLLRARLESLSRSSSADSVRHNGHEQQQRGAALSRTSSTNSVRDQCHDRQRSLLRARLESLSRSSSADSVRHNGHEQQQRGAALSRTSSTNSVRDQCHDRQETQDRPPQVSECH